MKLRFSHYRSPRKPTRHVNACAAVLAIIVASASAAFAQDEATGYQDLWEKGEYQQALLALESEIAANRGRVRSEWIVDRAELHFEVGRVDDAIQFLELEMGEYYPEPSKIEALARYYQYRGRIAEYQRTLEKGKRVVTSGRLYWDNLDDLVALGRILQMLGESPKTILSAYYEPLMERNPSFPEVQIAAGDLAYANKGYDVASRYYQKALELDPENLGALAGLAECYWQAYDGRLEETAARILGINPNHPRARAIQADKMLEANKVDEALEIIEDALAINPVSFRFLGLKAAAKYLEDDPGGVAEAQRVAIEFNPLCSEVYRVPGRLASRHYRFEDGAEFQAEALRVNPDDHEARALYAFDLLRIGQEESGVEQLELAFEKYPYDEQVYNMLLLMDSSDRFEVIERGEFRLQLPKNEAAIMADDALALLEDAAALYQEKYRIDLETPVHIQMFDNHDDFMVRALGLPGNAGHLGICFGKLVTMDSPKARAPGSMNWHSVLWHEFVHVITLQKTKNRMPRWLSEGISVYEETQRSSAWGQDMLLEFKPIIESEPLPGLNEIEAYFTEPKSTSHLMLGYFMAGEFVKFYVDAYSQEALVQSLERIAEKEPANDALAGAAETSKKAIEDGFKQYLETRLAPYDNLPQMAAPKDDTDSLLDRILGDKNPFATAEVSPFEQAMKDAQYAVERERWDDAEAALRKAYDLFPDYSAADAPLFQLIHVYSRQGKRDKLVEVLEQIVSEYSTPYSAIQSLLEVYQNQSQWEDILRVSALALGINPFDVAIRKAMLEAQKGINESDGALITLAQLAHLDPNRSLDYRLERAGILAGLGRNQEARTEAVSILEATPHFWEAQKMLLRITDGGQETEEPAATR